MREVGLSGVSDISYDTVVARSEFEHSARNAAIAWLMKSFGNFHHDVTTVLQNYFQYCALKMSGVELARTFVFLANQGRTLDVISSPVVPSPRVAALTKTPFSYRILTARPSSFSSQHQVTQADDPSGSIVFHTARQPALRGTDGLSPRIVQCPVSAAVRGNDGGQVTGGVVFIPRFMALRVYQLTALPLAT